MADEITAEPDANDDFDEDEGAVEVSDDGHHRLHVFSDLTLMNGANRLDELTAALERVVDEPWRRALERDESQSGLMEWRVFERRADEHLPGALLFLAPRRRDGAVYVSNIVPTRGRTLGKDNYNSILAEFTDKFVRGVAPSIALEVLLTQPWIDFADEIGPEAFHQLRAAANFKPGTHPMDRE